MATHSFGEFAERFHPHLHILATDGAFYRSACGHAQAGGRGVFRVASGSPMKTLEKLFRHRVLRMLLDKGRITPDTIKIMDRRRHPGFNVYWGPRILPREKKSMEGLAATCLPAGRWAATCRHGAGSPSGTAVFSPMLHGENGARNRQGRTRYPPCM